MDNEFSLERIQNEPGLQQPDIDPILLLTGLGGAGKRLGQLIAEAKAGSGPTVGAMKVAIEKVGPKVFQRLASLKLKELGLDQMPVSQAAAAVRNRNIAFTVENVARDLLKHW